MLRLSREKYKNHNIQVLDIVERNILKNCLHGFQLGLALYKRHLMVQQTLHFITNAIG